MALASNSTVYYNAENGLQIAVWQLFTMFGSISQELMIRLDAYET